MKKFLSVLLIISLLLSFDMGVSASSAEGGGLDITLSASQEKLTDGKHTSYATIESSIKINAQEAISALYIIFYDEPVGFLVNGQEKEASFLHQYIETDAKKEINLSFNEEVKICDIYAFSSDIPYWVQRWNSPVERADILLCPTHSDDDQLYFSGLLPYYAGERDYNVQVAYFVDHSANPQRRHELLNGLWTAGVTAYPVINPIVDLYSESADEALDKLAPYGVSEDDLIDFQVGLLRRFKPQVVIIHDFEGEYGHGMHMLNAKTMTRAIEISSNKDSYPQSAQQYGVWSVKKMYVHLYDQNKVVLDFDKPLEKFGGKTAYEVSCEAFQQHVSQHSYFFMSWLRGENEEYTNATQIKKYPPCEYGLYYTSVGEDIKKNDLFENLTDYKTIEKIEQEKQQAKQLAEQKEAEAERTQNKKQMIIRVTSAVVLVVAVAILIIAKIKKNRAR